MPNDICHDQTTYSWLQHGLPFSELIQHTYVNPALKYSVIQANHAYHHLYEHLLNIYISKASL